MYFNCIYVLCIYLFFHLRTIYLCLFSVIINQGARKLEMRRKEEEGLHDRGGELAPSG